MSNLIRIPKKRYILIKETSSSSPSSSSSGSWVAQGNWNGSTNLFPTIGRLGDTVKEGYTWECISSSTTLFGPDGGVIPSGVTIRAKVDNPGQTLGNWRIIY